MAIKKHFPLVLVIISLVGVNNGYAQIPLKIKWQSTLGGSSYDYGIKVFENSKGEFFTLGLTASKDHDIKQLYGQKDIMLTKFSKNGDKQWTQNYGRYRSFGYANSTDGFKEGSFSPTTDGGFILIGTMDTLDQEHIWIAKVDSMGNSQWQKFIGGTKGSEGIKALQTSDGGYMFCANSNCDDGDIPATYGIQGWYDIEIGKLDKNGNILWIHHFGGSKDDYCTDMIRTKDGGFLLTGTTFSKDFDLRNRLSDQESDALVLKLDANGNLAWSKVYGDSQDQVFYGVCEGYFNDFYCVGYTVDALGNDIFGNYNVTRPDAYMVNINDTGTPIFQKFLVGTNWDFINSVTLIGDQKIAVCGYSSSYDRDFKSNVYKSNLWIAILDNQCTLIDQAFLGGVNNPNFNQVPSYFFGHDILRSITGDLLVVGNSANPNPFVTENLGPSGTTDAWVFKLGSYNTIIGEFFIDKNQNGIKDTDEVFYTGGRIIIKKPDGDSVVLSGKSGRFSYNSGTGQYSISLVPDNPYYSIPNNPKLVTFDGFFKVDSVKFGLVPVAGVNDLVVNMIPLSPARPGFEVKYQVGYKNYGTTSISNPILTVAKDGRLQFLSAVPAATTVVADDISWNLPALNPQDSGSIIITMKAASPPTLNNSDTLQSLASIPINLESTQTDNESLLRQVVTGSFDPNDKSESFGGIISDDLVTSGGFLHYLIRFQNMGTDTAFNIIIRDTLNQQLDWKSLRIMQSSHNYQMQVEEGNKVTLYFNNIMLVDNKKNEPASHGYINFKIKPLNSLKVGDVVTNKASIYFDFNLPIQTNTCSTSVKTSGIAAPILEGIKTGYCNSDGAQKIKIINKPDVGSNIIVKVKLDTIDLPVLIDGSFDFTPSTLSIGAHLLIVSYSNAIGSKSTTTVFTINSKVNPNVSVGSNISTVINLVDQVIISAENTSGGGASPLFTFAKDKSMINVLRSESNNSQISIPPNTLNIGDNWIYVRMRTSEICYTAQIDIDSINIKRSAVTGLVDLDFPGQQINIFPNPFKQGIYLNGLNTGKKYFVTVSNVNGQMLFNRKIANVSAYHVQNIDLPTGTYWLSLYDETNKKLIGTIPIIKK